MAHFESFSALCRSRAAAWLVGMAGLACAAALSAQAQTNNDGSKPNPLDPKANVPQVIYQSSLKPDARAAGDKPIAWREANDTVARIGGWRVYAREAAKPASAAAAPMPAGHGGHSGHNAP